MGKNDMNHMQHLESVALSDCAVLETKEGTYKGSWKRAGGRSAWFMARRNLDRLITMMSPKEFPEYIKTYENVRDTIKSLDVSVHYNFDPVKQSVSPLPGTIEATRAILAMLLDSYESEDIFMKIRAAPGGEDGTVLACLRDARRYFMLVEAEMIAEGVVQPETQTYEQESDPYAIVAADLGIGVEELKTLLASLSAPYPSPAPSPQYQPSLDVRTGEPMPMGGGERRVPRRVEVAFSDSMGQPMVYGDLYQWRRPEDGTTWIVRAVAPQDGKIKIDGEPAVPEDGRLVESFELTHTDRATRPVDPVRELKPEFDKVISDGKVHEQGRPVRDPTPEERAAAWKAERHDGGVHAKEQNPLWPWHATAEEYRAMQSRTLVTDLFYTQRAVDIFQLEPVVESNKIPREIAQVYDMAVSDGHTWYFIKRDRVPREIDDNFPRLPGELNDKEFDESRSDFKFMYVKDVGDGKWKLRPGYDNWMREPN